jgi:hypothetical protein
MEKSTSHNLEKDDHVQLKTKFEVWGTDQIAALGP